MTEDMIGCDVDPGEGETLDQLSMIFRSVACLWEGARAKFDDTFSKGATKIEWDRDCT